MDPEPPALPGVGRPVSCCPLPAAGICLPFVCGAVSLLCGERFQMLEEGLSGLVAPRPISVPEGAPASFLPALPDVRKLSRDVLADPDPGVAMRMRPLRPLMGCADGAVRTTDGRFEETEGLADGRSGAGR